MVIVTMNSLVEKITQQSLIEKANKIRPNNVNKGRNVDGTKTSIKVQT